MSQGNAYVLIWTTTPWTLPSNLAVCVGPDITYCAVRDKADGSIFLLAESRLSAYYKKADAYEIIKAYKGATLKGWCYEPLFPYFADHAGAFVFLNGDFVTTEDGTGVVHMAPAYGEDDFTACKDAGISLVDPLDSECRFTNLVPDYAGQFCKDADKAIIKRLKDEKKLVHQTTIVHSYPFCDRTDTPLIYRAIDAWYVRVEDLRDKLVKNNAVVHWVPSYVGEKRFDNWLKEAKDWNISRNRFWGSCIPVWIADDKSDMFCVGSIAELEKLSGQKVTDLHKHVIDQITITKNGKTYRRTPEVLDCWFESGSMPYAQWHYPFEHQNDFNKLFPADFIAEGLDQTRGWFYTLLVLGTALFDKSPFKNVVVNGMVLAEDGKKMSKRLKNYPDPMTVLKTYGADALRLYMIQSAAVRAEELRFSEAGVKDIVRRILLKWWNAYTFFVSYAVVDGWSQGNELTNSRAHERAMAENTNVIPAILRQAQDGERSRTKAGTQIERNLDSSLRWNDKSIHVSQNILDQWIISRLQTLLKTTEEEMEGYRLYNVVPALLNFIEDLTNIYIRFNRKRFWGEGMTDDKNGAYQTLYDVLYTLAQVMAPFTPFLAETMYHNLKVDDEVESVHLHDYPVSHSELINPDLEASVALVGRVILMGRNVRDQNNIKVKVPLKTLRIIHRDDNLHDRLRSLEGYIKDELNVRVVEYLTNEDDFVELTAKANGAVLGKRLGKKFAEVNKALQALDSQSLWKLEHGGRLEVVGETLTLQDVMVYRKPKPGHESIVSDAYVTVELDTTLEEEQIWEGLAREVVNRIQKLRKTADLKLSDRIQLEYHTNAEQIRSAITANEHYIKEQTLTVIMTSTADPKGQASEVCEVEGQTITVALRVVA
ncbi:MAG: hypothetical protein ACD_62C00664G0001 [uncultured bacterium]|nr:MAG: hypothetical protein ACD_62C00664G0001 [uncultured bacterium]